MQERRLPLGKEGQEGQADIAQCPLQHRRRLLAGGQSDGDGRRRLEGAVLTLSLTHEFFDYYEFEPTSGTGRVPVSLLLFF